MTLPTSIKAVLWDMDGLLVDTEPLWTIAETEMCAALGATFTREAKAEMVGHRIDAAIPILLKHLVAQGVSGASEELLTKQLLERMVGLFDSDLVFLPGALYLLSRLAEAGIPSVLVSSSYRVLVDAIIARTPAGSFVASLGGDEVANAKPHPEPFVTAARLAGVAPGECLALEDSVAGMRSALAAGCAAIMIPSVPGVEPEAGWTALSSLTEVGDLLPRS